jgi:hypothetical protein
MEASPLRKPRGHPVCIGRQRHVCASSLDVITSRVDICPPHYSQLRKRKRKVDGAMKILASIGRPVRGVRFGRGPGIVSEMMGNADAERTIIISQAHLFQLTHQTVLACIVIASGVDLRRPSSTTP